MARIKPLTGPSYRTWRTEVEGVLRILGVWDEVCPPPPSVEVEEAGDGEAAREDGPAPALAPVAVSKGESRKSAFASVIIFDYCSDASLSLVLPCADAAERWARLKEALCAAARDGGGGNGEAVE
ncbi:hypothetical protein VE03_03941 [Pseudogymnoascus sp. 23342-1-I1]|nr:hypothetical protein VE03_03941 [Pseudogymnoascus sp. 23342-1-I1]